MKLLIIGDSMIKYLEQYLVKELSDHEVSFISLPGQTIQGITRRVSLINDTFDCVLVHVGTNNISRGSCTYEACTRKYDHLFKEVQRLNPVKVVVSAIVPRRTNFFLSGRDRMNSSLQVEVLNHRINYTNKYLDQYCQDREAFFFCRSDTSWEAFLGRDGLHLNRSGNDKLAALFVQTLKRINPVAVPAQPAVVQPVPLISRSLVSKMIEPTPQESPDAFSALVPVAVKSPEPAKRPLYFILNKPVIVKEPVKCPVRQITTPMSREYPYAFPALNPAAVRSPEPVKQLYSAILKKPVTMRDPAKCSVRKVTSVRPVSSPILVDSIKPPSVVTPTFLQATSQEYPYAFPALMPVRTVRSLEPAKGHYSTYRRKPVVTKEPLVYSVRKVTTVRPVSSPILVDYIKSYSVLTSTFLQSSQEPLDALMPVTVRSPELAEQLFYSTILKEPDTMKDYSVRRVTKVKSVSSSIPVDCTQPISDIKQISLQPTTVESPVAFPVMPANIRSPEPAEKLLHSANLEILSTMKDPVKYSETQTMPAQISDRAIKLKIAMSPAIV